MNEYRSSLPCKFSGAFIAPWMAPGIRAAYCSRRRPNRLDVIKKPQTTKLQPARNALRLGFVPLTDCAPLVMAQELGLFRKYGLYVTLSRELGWATIRDKIIHRELDAAHAVAGMPFAATLGLGSIPCDCLTALVLNLHGNAITLGEFDFGHGSVRTVADFSVFHRHNANEPSGDKAAWVIDHLRSSGLCKDAATLNFSLGPQVFRADIFEKAARLRSSTPTRNENDTDSEIQFVPA